MALNLSDWQNFC